MKYPEDAMRLLKAALLVFVGMPLIVMAAAVVLFGFQFLVADWVGFNL